MYTDRNRPYYYSQADVMHKRPLLESPPVPRQKRPLLQHPRDVGSSGHKRALLGGPPPEHNLPAAMPPYQGGRLMDRNDRPPLPRNNDRPHNIPPYEIPPYERPQIPQYERPMFPQHERSHLSPPPVKRQALLPTPGEWEPPPPKYVEPEYEEVDSDSGQYESPHNFRPCLLPPPNRTPTREVRSLSPIPHHDSRPLAPRHSPAPPPGLLPLPMPRNNNGSGGYHDTMTNPPLKREPLLRTPPPSFQGSPHSNGHNKAPLLLPLARAAAAMPPSQPRKPPLLPAPFEGSDRVPYSNKPANGYQSRAPPLLNTPPLHSPPERSQPVHSPPPPLRPPQRGMEQGSPMPRREFDYVVAPPARLSPTNMKRPLLPTPKEPRRYY